MKPDQQPDGKHCPECGKDIGVWPVFFASLPNRIFCRHCDARLAYREASGIWWLTIVALVLVLIVSGVVGAIAENLFNPVMLPIGFLVTLIACWVPIEYGLARRLRSRYILECRSRPEPERHDFGD